MQTEMDFRQGTLGILTVTFFTRDGAVEEQPAGFPTVSVIYIDPATHRITTAIPKTVMLKSTTKEGEYYLRWHIAKDHPTTEHQIIYRGYIDNKFVIGEDTVTILPLKPQCVFEPVTISTNVCECNE